MHSPTSIADRSEEAYISTGHLPEPERVQSLVSEAHARFIPALRLPDDRPGELPAGPPSQR